jgi:hypothetical protein
MVHCHCPYPPVENWRRSQVLPLAPRVNSESISLKRRKVFNEDPPALDDLSGEGIIMKRANAWTAKPYRLEIFEAETHSKAIR